MNIIKNRYLYFLISLLVIIPGLVFIIINWVNNKAPLPLGIDFTGGSLLEVQFTGARPDSDLVQTAFLAIAPDTDPVIQPRPGGAQRRRPAAAAAQGLPVGGSEGRRGEGAAPGG